MRKKYHEKSVPNDNRKKQNRNIVSKCDISSSDSIRKVLKCFTNSSLRTKRKLLEKIQRWRKYRKTSNFTTQLEQCTMKFNKNTAQGPIYVCTVCLQMWFHTSVYCISTIRWKTDNAKKNFQECTQEYTSVRGKQWICNTCKTSLQRGFWPKLSVVNGLGFPPQPEELKLLGMEEHVVSPRMLFFQMRSHHLGGRVQVTGNVVNVAVDVAPTVKLLPRSLDDFQTVSVKYKRKLEYKRAVFHENVRPAAIWKAIHYLIRNSSLFQDVGIQLNTDWLDKEYDKKVESDENKDQNDLSIQKILPHESVENLEEKCKDTDKSVSEHNINENHIHSSQSVFNIDVEEIDESQNIIQCDTLLHEMPTHPLKHDD